MKRMVVLLALLVAACGTEHKLAQVSTSDPVWRIAPEHWDDPSNDLTKRPTLPAGRLQTSTR